jgi:hypothetical protein
MADNRCHACGMPPGECYRICPTQDPYQGDQAAENADYEFNARYDDERERYAATVADADLFFTHPSDWRDDDKLRVNDDGTVTLITGTGGEHTYDPDMLTKPDSDYPF